MASMLSEKIFVIHRRGGRADVQIVRVSSDLMLRD